MATQTLVHNATVEARSSAALSPSRFWYRLFAPAGSALRVIRFVAVQLAQTVHNGWGILNVWDMILLRPMRGGLIDVEHPFCTGRDPQTGKAIWSGNLVYRTPPRADLAGTGDAAVIEGVGRFMAGLARQAAARPGAPHGVPNRMPPAIYFIHGAVHYNAGWLLFNDFSEAIAHFTDARFRREFRRFVRRERREPLVVFRERTPDTEAFAHFIGFVRAQLPYFANSNGRGRPPLWGNRSPHPTVNIVTGRWIRDVRMLRSESGRRLAPRPAISERYFADGPYAGSRSQATLSERALARLHDVRIRLRGERGNVYFVDRRLWRDGARIDPVQPPNLWDRLFGRRR